MTPGLKDKLKALEYCLEHEAYEDSAGHLCDLLELCRTKIITHNGMMYVNLEYMTRKYGVNPTQIKS